MPHNLTALATGLMMTTAALGADIGVPVDAPSIQAAINMAVDGDRVLVGPGVWNEWLNYRGRTITVESTHGPSATTIDAKGFPCAIQIATGEGNATTLRGFTITGGNGGLEIEGVNCGGGLFIRQTNPTIDNCIITNNTAQIGGGVSIFEADPTFSSVVVTGNTAELDGGGFRIHRYSHPTMTGCTITDNHCGVYGGGIAYGNDSNGYNYNCEISANTAGIRGGGIAKACDCSNSSLQGSDMCNNVPDHILGTWNDLGGNDLCPVCSSDVTADGQVNVDDILAIVAAWGGCVCIEDINGDSTVGTDDLLLVLADWGQCEVDG